ncbi:Putative ysc84 actin-binding domain-containing protein [Septoria linicola]|uniref:Ysc84 actin-binding domain-containing protein n=1 Tax=Septoria linicola TaxID=215465 RepID=A0A9Q9ALR7_9PEZI|nr:putative ysc84 actin-binding domain-containing protein [Septoria linicola]USW49298.1 Putative ysc84 actin-binding domain-containing protein [Septoria linicola]
MWQRVKTGSKAGFDKAYAALDKLGPPINNLSNKLGSEAFWPTTLDEESDKAARILKSFCKDGFYTEEEVQPDDGPKQKQRVIQKIPEKVIREAKGLAIFTTMRTGLWVSGAGGSGILIAKKDDGTWSPPSGIMLHTAGLGFLVGVDIYDCVVVINTQRALDAFTKVRCTLGGEVSVVAGPVGAGALLETSVHKHQAPVYTYLKSRGFYAGVQIDGTIVIERMDENERFYGQKLPVAEILAGKVRHPPYEVRRLLETIKAAQGDTDVDEDLLPSEAPPGDYELDDGQSFGVPKMDDPDPYGVLALEKEGMSLKEAGSQKRASWEQFSFNPAPTSPIYTIYNRSSQDFSARAASRRNSWRSSAFSAEAKTPSSLRNSLDQRRSLVVMTDTSTQTEVPTDAPTSPSRRSISGHSQHSSKGSVSYTHNQFMQDVPEHEVLKTPQKRADPINVSAANGYTTPPHTPPGIVDMHQASTETEADDDEPYDDVQIIEQKPVIHSIQAVQPVTSQVISKARLVTVPKRLPPKLPPRNPGRNTPVVVDASIKSRTPSPTNSALSGSPDVGSTSADTKPNALDIAMPEQDSAVPEEGSAKPQSSDVHKNTVLEATSETAAASTKAQESQLLDESPNETETVHLDLSKEAGEARQEDHGTLGTRDKMPGGFD